MPEKARERVRRGKRVFFGHAAREISTPCHQFADDPEYKMGNVFDGTLNEEIRAVFRNANLFTKEKCKNCFAKYHCSGGCAANNIHFGGDIVTPYEITCEMMKARMECALHLYARARESESAQ